MRKKLYKGWDAIVLSPTDQLATALRHLKAGNIARFLVGEEVQELEMSTDVAICHKFSIRDVTHGEKLRKYGEIIGEASKPITAGEHAHIHNIKSLRAIHKRF